MSRTLVVAGAVVDSLARPTLLLAARRSAPAALAGGWELPGGKVDEDEPLDDALRRELLEELGIEVRLGDDLPGPCDGGWPLGQRYLMYVRLACIASGVPAPLEDHDELRWLAASELETVPWLPDDLPVVRALAAHLSTPY